MGADKFTLGFQIKLPDGIQGYPPRNGIALRLLAEYLASYHLKSMAPVPSPELDLNNCMVVITSDNSSMQGLLVSLLDRMDLLDFATVVRLNDDGKTWKTLYSPDGPADVVQFVNPEFAAELDKLRKLLQSMDTLPSGKRVS